MNVQLGGDPVEDTLERLFLWAGLGTPWNTRRAGRAKGLWKEISGPIASQTVVPEIHNNWQIMNGWMDLSNMRCLGKDKYDGFCPDRNLEAIKCLSKPTWGHSETHESHDSSECGRKWGQ